MTVDKKTRAPFPLDRINNIINRAKQLGLIVKSMGQALEFAPPLIIQKAEIDDAVDILDRCIALEARDFGF